MILIEGRAIMCIKYFRPAFSLGTQYDGHVKVYILNLNTYIIHTKHKQICDTYILHIIHSNYILS